MGAGLAEPPAVTRSTHTHTGKKEQEDIIKLKIRTDNKSQKLSFVSSQTARKQRKAAVETATIMEKEGICQQNHFWNPRERCSEERGRGEKKRGEKRKRRGQPEESGGATSTARLDTDQPAEETETARLMAKANVPTTRLNTYDGWSQAKDSSPQRGGMEEGRERKRGREGTKEDGVETERNDSRRRRREEGGIGDGGDGRKRSEMGGGERPTL